MTPEDPVYHSVYAAVDDSFYRPIADTVYAAVNASTYDSIFSSVWCAVFDAVVEDSVYSYIYNLIRSYDT